MAHSFGPRQLVLALDHAVSFAREDFLSGPSNAAALTLIERWPDWPDRIMALDQRECRGIRRAGQKILAREADGMIEREHELTRTERMRHAVQPEFPPV